MREYPPRIELECVVCGNKFEVQPYRLEANARFCSQQCYGEWRKGKVFSQKIKATTQEICAQYESGSTLQEVADKYEVTVQAIWYHLQKLGIKAREFDHGAVLRRPDVQEKAKQVNRQRTGNKNSVYIDLPVDDIYLAYQSGESTAQIAVSHGVTDGTIARRLRDANVKMRRRGYCASQICSDGDIADSMLERTIDDWLFSHNIMHEIHPTVPWYTNGKSPQRADFKVDDTFIEVWGIEGNKRYDERRLAKITKYKECSAALIEIFPHHILDNDYSPLECLLPV